MYITAAVLAEARVRLGGACVKCGSSERLEFDHIDRKTKAFNIGRRRAITIESFEAELAKCQLLCRPCHREKTLAECGWNPHWQHGTHSGYTLGCRCEPCRAACRDYMREYMRMRARRRRALTA